MSDVFSLSEKEARAPISVTLTTGGTDALERARNLLAGVDKGFRRAIGSAILRTGTSTKAFIAKQLRQDYFLTSSSIKKHTLVRSKPKNIGNGFAEVDISFKGSHIPLIEFDTHLDRKGRVTTRVKRSSPRATLEHGFVQTIPGRGHRGIFERVSDERLPIREFLGPSVPQMLSYNEELQTKITDHALETFEKRLDHEVSAILNGWRE